MGLGVLNPPYNMRRFVSIEGWVGGFVVANPFDVPLNRDINVREDFDRLQ